LNYNPDEKDYSKTDPLLDELWAQPSSKRPECEKVTPIREHLLNRIKDLE